MKTLQPNTEGEDHNWSLLYWWIDFTLRWRSLFVLLFIGIIFAPVMAQSSIEEGYLEEFNKLKPSSDYITRDGDQLEYSLIDFNPDFEYYILITSYPVPTDPAIEIPVKESNGKLEFRYPGSGKVQVHLMRRFPEKYIGELCKKYQYISSYGDLACDSTKNLDIIVISPATKIEPSDSYILKLRGWSRAFSDRINGASWQALFNYDTTEKK